MFIISERGRMGELEKASNFVHRYGFRFREAEISRKSGI